MHNYADMCTSSNHRESCSQHPIYTQHILDTWCTYTTSLKATDVEYLPWQLPKHLHACIMCTHPEPRTGGDVNTLSGPVVTQTNQAQAAIMSISNAHVHEGQAWQSLPTEMGHLLAGEQRSL